MAVWILDVEEKTPAYQAGLRGGMQLISIDGHNIFDGIDYEFYASACNPILKARENETGPVRSFFVEKKETQDLGCRFETYLISPQQHCKNKCQFCFIDQLPKGLRSSLYFKDDDERMGFLFGNYITLTNLGEHEIERIIEMRISPVNISVHTANPQLRNKLMGNANAGTALEFLQRLAKADITLNTQLVLCPGINDGEELEHSIEWLSALYPALQSIAAVPVGLTRYRDGLAPLKTYTKQQAAQQLARMLSYGERFLKEYGERIVFPSDEWFLLSGYPIPPYSFYEGFMQLENGVGMWRLLYDEFMQALEEVEEEPATPIRADIATGVLAAPLIQELMQAVQTRFPNSVLHVHKIENEFFGPNITVAGLITGQDLVKQLDGKLATETLLIPENMLRSEGDLFLCGMHVEELSQHLDVDVNVVACDGDSLLYALIEL